MKSFSLVCIFLSVSFQLTGQRENFNRIDFHQADSIALLYPKHSLKNLKVLADKLTGPLSTDVEKFRSIYRWVCANIEYDVPLFQKNQHQREKLKDPLKLQQWYKKMNEMMFDALLRKHRTVCTGYAYLIKELANHVGISCEIIDGYGRNSISNIGGTGIPSHQWNSVRLDGKWHLCDATWSSGSVLSKGGFFVKDFNESYFLTDPELFVRNHYPIDTAWILLSNKPTLTEFLHRPIIYSQFIKLKATTLLPETFEVLAARKTPVIIRFNSGDGMSLENVSLQINDSKIEHPDIQPDANGLYMIKHAFSSRGMYLVHINQNNQPLISYKVKVQ